MATPIKNTFFSHVILSLMLCAQPLSLAHALAPSSQLLSPEMQRKIQAARMFLESEKIFLDPEAKMVRKAKALQKLGEAVRKYFVDHGSHASRLIVRPLSSGAYEILHVRQNSVARYGTLSPARPGEIKEFLHFRWTPEWEADKTALNVNQLGGIVGGGGILERLVAVEALGMMGEQGADAAWQLVMALQEDNQALRLAIAEALPRLGPGAIRFVAEGIKNLEGEAKIPAVHILSRMGDAALPALVSFLSDDTRVWVRLPDPLTEEKEKINREVSSEKKEEIQDEYQMTSVQDVVIDCLAKMKGFDRDDAVAVALANAMDDPNKCRLAALLLIDFRPADEDCIRILQEMVADRHERFVLRVSAALSLFGKVELSGEAIRVLVAHVEDSSAPVMIETLPALRAIGVKALPQLIEAVRDTQRRQTAASLLGALGVQASEAIPALTAALEKQELVGDDDIHRAFPALAALALARIGALENPYFEARLTEDFIQVKGQEREGFLFTAAIAFAEAGESAVPYLIKAYYGNRSSVRDMAALALENMGQAAIPELLEYLRKSQRKWHAPAASALARIGRPVLAPLQAILDNGSTEPTLLTRSQGIVRQVQESIEAMRRNTVGLSAALTDASL